MTATDTLRSSKMHASYLVFLGAMLMLSAWPSNTYAFSSTLPNTLIRPSTSSTNIHGGVGIADTYSWNEEQFEIEVKLTVPPGTSAKDVKFKCSSESIDMHLLTNNDDTNDDDQQVLLLDGSRKTRGTICVDGTFWSIEGNAEKERTITITIEKHFVPISSTGGTQTFDTLTDFDWGGLYPNDEEEVSYRKYDEAEELNVKEYAAKMGVDIDNLDMSKVNKTMFGAGLGADAAAAANGMGEFDEEDAMENNDGDTETSKNSKGFHFNITQATLEQLTKAGLAKEVIQQGDGTEYELGTDGSLNEEDIFSMLGKDISNDELREAGIVGGGGGGGGGVGIPSMWEQQTLPVEEAPGYQKTFDAGNSLVDGIIETEIVDQEIITTPDSNPVVDITGTGVVEGNIENDSISYESIVEAGSPPEKSTEATTVDEDLSSKEIPVDPIDLLTVARLKEILRAQGLKVSGTKQILRDRLRNHVNTLLQDE
ncbi:hypothetical protein ACHAXR_009875 [Thalassiosira sp. AJA248-18]